MVEMTSGSNDTRIGYQETGNIGPVLVDVCVTALATMEPVMSEPPLEKVLRSVICVEARNINLLVFASFAVLKEDDGCRINEIIAQIICHDNTVQIFTTEAA